MKKLKDNYQYKTKSLIIRFYQEEDLSKWQKLFSEMLPKQNQWDWEKRDINNLTEERFLEKLKRHKEERYNGNLYYFCVENIDNDLIGIGLIQKVKDDVSDSVEIGFQLNNLYWGKGLGKELAYGLKSICLKDLDESNIVAKVNKKKESSIHIVEGIGMKKISDTDTQLVFCYQ